MLYAHTYVSSFIIHSKITLKYKLRRNFIYKFNNVFLRGNAIGIINYTTYVNIQDVFSNYINSICTNSFQHNLAFFYFVTIF